MRLPPSCASRSRIRRSPGRRARVPAGACAPRPPDLIPIRKKSARAGRALGSFVLAASAVGVVPGDPRDIPTGDADIGQLAVAQLVELTQTGVVALPGPDEVDDCD